MLGSLVTLSFPHARSTIKLVSYCSIGESAAEQWLDASVFAIDHAKLDAVWASLKEALYSVGWKRVYA
ncbi:hypothetical protein BKA81DRAFT_371316 [Phyllosticta paracitricarpa]